MLPSGIILEWSGSIASIPNGFVLCDGNNNTPDLRNRFIVGAGDTYAVDETGGALNHSHPFTGDGHDHVVVVGAQISAGAAFSNITSTDPVTGTTDGGSSLPPFYSLAFIMKT